METKKKAMKITRTLPRIRYIIVKIIKKKKHLLNELSKNSNHFSSNIDRGPVFICKNSLEIHLGTEFKEVISLFDCCTLARLYSSDTTPGYYVVHTLSAILYVIEISHKP